MKHDVLIILALIAAEVALIVAPHPLKPVPVVPPAHTADGGSHWSYEGTGGPAYWGDISAEYQTCKSGTAQTPVAIESAAVVPATVRDLSFQYQPLPLAVINNGHTVQVNAAPGSTVRFQGQTYQLAQFHFHVPSEHVIDGKAWPMNVHFVHKDERNRLLVVEVLFAEGVRNAELAKIMTHLPQENAEIKDAAITVDITKLLPQNIASFHYEGSLTTPPCTEGVSWFVLRSAIDVGKQDVDAFKALFPMNARPVQPLHGRKIELL